MVHFFLGHRCLLAAFLMGGLGLAACQSGPTTPEQAAPPPAAAAPAAAPAAASAGLQRAADAALRHLAAFTLDSLNAGTAPGQYIRFSPYGQVDTAKAKAFTPALLKMVTGSEKKVYWADYPGSGQPMDLDVKTYFQRYVNDRPYARADSVLLNRSVSIGSAGNNLKTVFPGTEYVEYFCQGTAPNPDHTWKALRLVFRPNAAGSYVLVAVVHNEWTI